MPGVRDKMKKISRYLSTFSFNKDYPFHHSNRNAIENKIYVALDHGEPFLPRKVEGYLRDTVEKRADFANEGFELLEKTISAAYLITFGCSGKASALKFAELRLAAILTHRCKDGQEYYLSDEEKKKYSIPKKYASLPVLNPMFDPWIGICPLPTIHDLYLLKAFADGTGAPNSHQSRIISYVMSKPYQHQVVNGYGYSYFIKTKRIYSCDWSCHLGTKQYDRNITPSSILPRSILLSSFPEARGTPIFRDAKRFLVSTYHEYRNKLPLPFLTESPHGYWVEGAFMSFRYPLTPDNRSDLSGLRLRQMGVSNKELKAMR
jgi:hypothetical protein